MQLPSQLDIYKASAGSGKTFLLTLQYLQLIFQSPKSFRNILAVTFTNKATAEMKSRILEELEKIAHGESTEYSRKLLEQLPEENPGSLQEKAKEIYSNILHDYSRFSVSTIDSFVQKVIRSFAYEIGLDAGFTLKLNTDLVKEDLAERLYRLLDIDENLRKWVTELAVRRLSEGKSWNFRDDMLALASEIFKDSFQEFEKQIGQLQDVDAAFKSLRDKAFAIKADFENRFKKAGQEAVQLLESNGLSQLDFPYKAQSFANFFFKAMRGEIDMPGKRVTDVLEDARKMHTKPPNSSVALIESQILHLLNKLCTQCTNEMPLYNSAVLLSNNVGTLRLMQVFSEELKNYRSENRELLISDTHLLLRRLTAETEASFIFEKTGNRYRHFLIDEFQDTSTLQWENFKPLLENSLGEGHYNLVVGDVKQAIYRWRGGDRKLLQQQVKKDLQHFKTEDKVLEYNFRSTKPVIEFNNFLYTVLPAMLQARVIALIGDADAQVQQQLRASGYGSFITDAYEKSQQLVPEKASPLGHINIRFLPESEELDYDEQMLPLLYDQIISLLEEGFLASHLGILTRNNREAETIINYLSRRQQEEGVLHFDILSSDALMLAKNNAVALLVCALDFISGKGGKLSLANLRHFVAVQQNKDVSWYERFIAKEGEDNVLPPSFFAQKERLRRLPLPELISELIGMFALHANSFDAAYLLAFQDLVSEWSRFGNDGIAAFLSYWEDEGIHTSLEAGGNTNALHVMTIHKSKGLDFTLLLLPYLDWDMKPSSNKGMQVWVNTNNTVFNDVPVVPVRYSSSMEKTIFGFEYYRELLDTMIDNLNLLYVATTRARRRIFGWAPKPKKPEDLNGIQHLLYSAVTDPVAAVNIETASIVSGFDIDTQTWTYGSDDAHYMVKDLPENSLLPFNAPTDWRPRLTVQIKMLETAEETQQQLPRKVGVLLHDAIARLQNPHKADTVVKQMYNLGIITASQQAQVKQVLQAVLAQPVMQDWKAGEMQRLSERDIVNNNREIRRPDLVLYNNEKTIVIDFKFTEERGTHHRYEKQVREYIGLLQQTGFNNISGYLMYAGNDIELVPVN